MVNDKRFHSFAEFWPFYVSEHAHAGNRALHVVGTSLGLGVAALAIAGERYAWVAAAPVVGYAFSWFGHFFVEKNVPATFSHPLWSFRADFKMLALVVTGRMRAELARLGSIEPDRGPRIDDRT